jgi:hypothetical protein
MSITRTTLLSGPAAATFAGHTFFANDGILVTPALEIAEAADRVDSDTQGVLDATVSGAAVTIKFTPSAPFADLLALYPYAMANPGTPLFGPSDTPLVLIAANGVRLTFAAVAIVQMPDLFLTTRGPVTGAVTFLALGARSIGLTMANRFVALDTAAMPSPVSGTPQLADDFAITWGGAPWLNLRAQDGVRVRFVMPTRAVVSDANALQDLTLERLEVQASFTPASPGGPAEIDLIEALNLQGAEALPGRPLSGSGYSLEIQGEHLRVQLPLASLTRGELAFDAVHPRLGELTFVSKRAFLGSGLPAALVGLTEGMPLD